MLRYIAVATFVPGLLATTTCSLISAQLMERRSGLPGVRNTSAECAINLATNRDLRLQVINATLFIKGIERPGPRRILLSSCCVQKSITRHGPGTSLPGCRMSCSFHKCDVRLPVCAPVEQRAARHGSSVACSRAALSQMTTSVTLASQLPRFLCSSCPPTGLQRVKHHPHHFSYPSGITALTCHIAAVTLLLNPSEPLQFVARPLLRFFAAPADLDRLNTTRTPSTKRQVHPSQLLSSACAVLNPCSPYRSAFHCPQSSAALLSPTVTVKPHTTVARAQSSTSTRRLITRAKERYTPQASRYSSAHARGFDSCKSP